MVVKTIKKIIYFFCAAMIFSSCNDGLFGTLNRTTLDPFTEIPTVISFLESHSITVKWTEDEGADEYILERALDSIMPVFSEVYRGNATEYVDRNKSDETLYLYRLSKRRGQKTFPASDPALGVSTLTTRDSHEENNDEKKATYLSYYTLSANMPFYRAYNGLTVSDADWYCVDIPPRWMVSIVIVDLKIEYGTETHFRAYIKDTPPQDVIQSYPFHITNYENFPARHYFKIYPKEGKYIDAMGGGAGGAVVDYTIQIIQFLPMS